MTPTCHVCKRRIRVGEDAWATDWTVIGRDEWRTEVRYTCDDCEEVSP